MTAAWHDPVLREALAAGAVLALGCALLSVMALAHRLAFLSVSASHASLAGAGAAALWHLPMLPAAGAASVLLAVLLAFVPRARFREDAAAGALFAGGMAVGAILLARAGGQGAFVPLLFGDLLALSPEEVRWLLAGTAFVALGFAALGRAWWRLAVDPDAAEAMGEPVRALRVLLHLWFGAGVVLAVKAVGIVLATALLTLPAAIAVRASRGLLTLALGAGAAAVAGLALGLGVAWARDWPAGPAIALALIALWLAAALAAWLAQRLRKARAP